MDVHQSSNPGGRTWESQIHAEILPLQTDSKSTTGIRWLHSRRHGPVITQVSEVKKGRQLRRLVKILSEQSKEKRSFWFTFQQLFPANLCGSRPQTPFVSAAPSLLHLSSIKKKSFAFPSRGSIPFIPVSLRGGEQLAPL